MSEWAQVRKKILEEASPHMMFFALWQALQDAVYAAYDAARRRDWRAVKELMDAMAGLRCEVRELKALVKEVLEE